MMRAALTFAFASLALTACDGEDPVNAALRDASAARHAAATRATGEVEAVPQSASVVLAPADRAWIEATIADHGRVIATTEALLLETENAAVRRSARSVIAARQREVAELQALLVTSPTG